MRFLIAALAVVAAAVAVSASVGIVNESNIDEAFFLRHQFEQFKTTHNKVYETPELELYRFNIFMKNMNNAQTLQQKNPKATFGMTRFADLEPAEFKRIYLNYKPAFGRQAVDELMMETAAPAHFIGESEYVDWRKKGVVTPVKDQGQCGSCWAFSATEQCESSWALAGRSLTKFAPQQVVDCDTAGSDMGCSGGDTTTAYAYILKAGFETEESYPYTSGNSGQGGTCQYKESKVVAKFGNWSYAIPPCKDSCAHQDEDLLQKQIVHYGPASICVAADAWQMYTGGVFTDKSSCPSDYSSLDHCVQLVGIEAAKDNSGEDAWLIRNSWADSWGEAGYIRVKKGENLCGIADEVTFVSV